MADLPPAYIERRLVATTTVVLLTVALTVQVGLNGTVLLTPVAGSRTELVVYGVLAVLGGGCAVALFVRGRIPGPVRWVGVAVLLCCSAAMSGVLPPHAVLPPDHWSIGVIGWYGLVLLYDLPIGWMVGFLLAHVAVIGWAGGAVAADLPEMGVTFVSVAGFQLGVALGARLLRTIAASAFRASRAEEERRVREEEAAAAARNHERRYADLRGTTIPLLAGLADGGLDPGAEAVRRRCAIEAARMRRLLTEGQCEGAADLLVHELGAIIDVAERHGASVHLSVRGTPRAVPEHVRRDLLAPISEALVTARSQARVTVLHGPDQVRVSARCAAPDLPITPPGQGEVALVESVTDGQVWLETSWRSR